MAARCGAARVTSCEMLRPVAAAAKKIVARNGFKDVIEVIDQPSTRLTLEDLDGAADVVVSEIVASDLIGEGILRSLEDVRRLLKPGARTVPQRASVRGVLAFSEELERYLRVGIVAGFDLRDFNELSPATLYPGDLGVALQSCSSPFDLLEFDFTSCGPFFAQRRQVTVAVERDGRCAGVLQWIRLVLFDDVVLENAPLQAEGAGKGHWKPILHTFAEPLLLRAGQKLRLSVAHNRSNLQIYPEAVVE